MYWPMLPLLLSLAGTLGQALCNSCTKGCPPVRGDNPRALASGLSYVQVDNHGTLEFGRDARPGSGSM